MQAGAALGDITVSIPPLFPETAERSSPKKELKQGLGGNAM
jgi:hypothetical protein